MHILIKSCKTLFGISCSPAYIGSCLGVSFVLLLYATLWSPLPYPFPHYSELTSIQKYIKLKYMFIQMQKYSYNHIVNCDETGHSEIPSIRVKNNLGTVVSKIGYVLNSAEAETLLSATLIHEVCNI